MSARSQAGGRKRYLWLGCCGLVALACGLLLIALAWGFSASGRHRILETVEARAASASGLDIQIGDFHTDLLAAAVELEDVSVATPGHTSFLEVDSVRLEVSPASLVFPPLVIRSVEIEGATLDLARPMPTQLSGSASGVGEVDIEVRRFHARGGSVVNGRLGAAPERWFRGWSVSDLKIEGSFEGAVLRIQDAQAEISLARGDGSSIGLRFESAGMKVDARESSLERVVLEGPGLILRANRLAGSLDSAQMRGRLEAEIVPEELIDLPATSGRLELRADLGDRSIFVQGRRLQMELLLPLVSVPAAGALLPGTFVDLEAQLHFGLESLANLAGNASISWSNAEEVLLRAHVASVASAELEGLSFEVSGELFPGAEGERTFAGRLAVPEEGGLEATRLAGGSLRLRIDELASEWQRIASLWQEPLEFAPPEALLHGALRLDGTLAGDLTALSTEMEADWLMAPGSRFQAALSGSLASREWQGEIVGTDLDLQEFDRSLTGVASARGLWSYSEEDGLTARLSLSGSSLGHSESEWRVQQTELSIGVVRDLVTVERFRASLPNMDVSGTGSLTLAELVTRADLALQVRAHGIGMEPVQVTLSLQDGVIRALAPSVMLARGEAGFEAFVPWSDIARLPGLEGLLDWPVEAGTGPTRLTWRTGKSTDWAALLDGRGFGERIEQLSFGLEGEMEIEGGRLAGARGEMVLVDLEAKIAGRRMSVPGRSRIGLAEDRLDLATLTLRMDGESLVFEARADLDPSWTTADPPSMALVDLEVSGEGSLPADLLLPVLNGPPQEGSLGLSFRIGGGTGSMTGQAKVELVRPMGGLQSATADLRLSDGWLRARIDAAETTGVHANLEASASLITLASVGGWEELGQRLDAETERGSGLMPCSLEAICVQWQLPPSEWTRLLAKLGVEDAPTSVYLAATGDLEIDPRKPLAGRSKADVRLMALEVDGRSLEMPARLELSLEGGLLQAEASLLQIAKATPDLVLNARLNESWSFDQPVSRMIESFSARGAASVPATFLNPFLVGGEAKGPLHLRFEAEPARGSDLSPGETSDASAGRLRIDGREVSILFREPYTTRVDGFEMDIDMSGDGASIRNAEARLNDGRVRLEGGWERDGGLDVAVELEGVRYRLDYGLLVELGANLRLASHPAPGAASRTIGERLSLSGEIVVERGALTRDIQLDRSLLEDVLMPLDLSGSEQSDLDLVDLDLTFGTLEGVRISNNLAEIQARWDPLRIRGTLAEPGIEGRIEIEPGGLVYAFGQTLRLDRAEVVYSGVPGAEPVLTYETTSSLEDSSIGKLSGNDSLDAALQGPMQPQPAGGPSSGIATLLAEQIAGRIAESIGPAGLTVRPVLIFGEVDPGARLTIGTEVSANVSLATSLDLRNAERQTYLLGVHDLKGLPGLTGQVFTTDTGGQGGTLAQRLRFGGGAVERDTRPIVRKVVLEAPPGVSRRALRRSLGYGKRDRLPSWGPFSAEIEAERFLGRKGFPDARVRVERLEVEGRASRVDLVVEVKTGPEVEFRFDGDLPGARLRRSITDLYRTGYWEPESLAEMEAQAVRALRSKGFLRPTARVEVQPGRAGRPRVVLISVSGGEQVKLKRVSFEGVPQSVGEDLELRFSRPVQRVELAAGEAGAVRRLLAGLEAKGFVGPRIRSRALSEDGGHLTVDLLPGERRVLAGVGFEGNVEDSERLLGLTNLRPGDPVEADRLAAAVLAVESDFRSRGFDDVKVRAWLDPPVGAGGLEHRLRFEIEMGPRYSLGKPVFEGLSVTRERWAAKVADLSSESGDLSVDMASARRRLRATGLFETVESRAEKSGSGSADAVFQLDEGKPRSIAYGLRWDSEDGTAAVVDVVDRNVAGRGIVLGLRALWAEKDRSARVSGSIPRLAGSKLSLDTFALMRNQREETFEIDTLEGTLQVGHPVGKRGTARIYGRYREVTLREEDPLFPIVFEIKIRNPFLGLQFIHEGRRGQGPELRGIFGSADLSVSDEFLGSDFRFARFFGQANLYRGAGRLGSRRLQWAQSFRVGYAQAFDQELLRSEFLLAGGEYSVRGYARETLGPPEKSGLLVPSLDWDSLFVMNQELRFEVVSAIDGLLFFDAGNTWTSIEGLDTNLFKSIGFGVRARSPVGLLRLDFAYPLDRRDEIDAKYKIYFGFGDVF